MTKVKIFSELRNKQTDKVTMEANLFSSEFMEVKEISEFREALRLIKTKEKTGTTTILEYPKIRNLRNLGNLGKGYH